MGMGRRKEERQQELWIATGSLPETPQHVFYEKLNKLLGEAGFDAFVEELCTPFYVANTGRDSIPPGVYFRMLFVGYFEGIDSQRGIAWRCADSRSIARFLGYAENEATPDHSSLTRIRNRLSEEIHGNPESRSRSGNRPGRRIVNRFQSSDLASAPALVNRPFTLNSTVDSPAVMPTARRSRARTRRTEYSRK